MTWGEGRGGEGYGGGLGGILLSELLLQGEGVLIDLGAGDNITLN